MKKSAGILVYKKEDSKIKVLLCHLGGPYWKDNYENGWSLSKGLVNNGEKVIDAALREFKEETNLDIKSNIKFLSSKKVSKNKLVIMFYTESDFDLSNCISNTFELESPKGSGIIKEFPEMDKYEWFDIEEAKKHILNSQIYFLDKLENIIKSR